MHRRRMTLLTAVLTTSAAIASSTAGAQHFQTTAPTPTYVVVHAGTYTWTANKVAWPNGAPQQGAMGQPASRGETTAQLRTNTKPAATTVELVSAMQNANLALSQWRGAVGSAQPMDITITLMTESGTPVTTYYLHNAVPTKVWANAMDAGSSQIALEHVTLTAQSITVGPTEH